MAMGSEGMGVWELPEGWSTARLGELVEMKTGFACAKKNLVTEGLPHLRPFNVSTEGELDLTKVYHIPKDFKENADDYTLEPGHILFNNTNSVELVGKTAIVRQSMRCAYSNHITRLTVLDKRRLEPNWLALSLKQLWATGFFAANCNKWIGQAGVNTEMLAAVEVPLPYPNDPTRSLAEQRRIVARIEELFARIAEARRLRLAAKEDTEALLLTASDEVFETLLGDGQPRSEFRDLITASRNGLYKPQSFYGSGTLIARIDSFEGGRIRDFGELKRLEVTQDELDKYSLQAGDILINRVNGSLDELGKAAVVLAPPEPTVFESNIMRFRLNKQKVLPEFVVAYLSSREGHNQIRAKARAIQQFSINQADVGSIVIPVPSLPEQHSIVEYLDGVQAQVAELKRVQAESAAELERLEGAILARAFRGDL
jgi:type I restriction enzyme S subunit